MSKHGQPFCTGDALGQLTALIYDNDRNARQITQANNNKVDLSYDLKGNVTGTTLEATTAQTQVVYEPIFSQPTSITDALGHATTITYDNMGNPTAITDAQGHVSIMTFNTAGQVLTRTDPLGHTTSITYNVKGLPATVTDPLGRTVSMVYDLAGNVTGMTDPAGRVSGSVFDSMNRVTQTAAADGGVTRYGYDRNGDLLTLTDPNNHARSWTYDARRRVRTATDALGRATTVSYDGQGNVISRTRKDGTVITYGYDALNRVKQVNLPALPNGVPADTVTMSYDLVGNVVAMNDNDSTVGNVFDALSRLTQTTQTYGSSGASLAYTYDLMNRRATMADSLGNTTYSYDELNRLIGLTDPAGRSFSFGFDSASRPTAMTSPNGVNASMGYDAADQLLSLAYANGNTTIASAGYQYNLTGTRSSEAREDGNARTFGYDPVDRVLSSLNSALPPSRNEAFSYDPEGNWTTNGRVHDAADELTQDANYNYTYDQEGNLTQKLNRTDPTDVTTYTYDAANRLVGVQTPAAAVTYAYDAMGRRVTKAVNGTATRYILDGQNVRLELDGANALTAANTHAGLDRLLVRDQGGTPLFFQGDALGSTTALTDATGTVLERYRYSVFGKIEVLDANFQPSTLNQPRVPYTYTGREWESEAGLYFNRARFYDPVFGRFVSRDPIGEMGGLNLYGYVENNPLIDIDPLGLVNWKTVGQGTLTTIGGAGTMVGGAFVAGATGVTVVGAVVGGAGMFVGATSFGLGITKIADGFRDNPGPPTNIPQGPLELTGLMTGSTSNQSLGAVLDIGLAFALPPNWGGPLALASGYMFPSPDPYWPDNRPDPRIRLTDPPPRPEHRHN